MAAGFLLVLLAGVMNGSFATPMKRVQGWAWEHTWLVWSATGLVVFPWIVALATVPGLAGIYGGVSWGAIGLTALFGFLWGVSAVLFGLGIDRLGLALGFGIIIGISSVLGAVVPLVFQHPEQIATTRGMLTLGGAALVLLGVAGCAGAGRIREQTSRKGSLAIGLVICVASGLGAPMINFGLAFGNEIVDRALNAIWPLLLGAGFLANAGYCGWLIGKGSGWTRYATERPAANFGLAALMGLLWFGSNLAYGYGSQSMGELGFVMGWPVFMGAVVLTANAWGALTGEWRGAPAHAVRWMAAGVVLLIAGVALIGRAGGA